MESSSDESDPDKKKGEINPPPITLPPPDPFDTRKSREGSNSFERKSKRKKKKRKGRNHPTDVYKDVRRESRGSGCCAGLALFGLAVVAALGGLLYWLGHPFLQGFELVWSPDSEVTITEAPEEGTLYLAPLATVKFDADLTSVPLGIVAKHVEVSGDFGDNVYMRGITVSAANGTRFAGDLNIYAIQFRNDGVVVHGSMSGQTLR